MPPRQKSTAKKGKGKEAAGSSRPNKRPNTQRDEGSDDGIRYEPTRILSETRKGATKYTYGGPQHSRLSKYNEDDHEDRYNAKINGLQKKVDGFLLEKDFTDPDYRIFGIPQKFEALGWENILSVYDGEEKYIYMEPVQEWVSTLKYVRGDNHPFNSKMVGTVNDQEVVMSFRTLDRIAKFDNNSNLTYEYPSPSILYGAMEQQTYFTAMKEALYEGPSSKRGGLKWIVRILLIIVIRNVMPKRGDLTTVRSWEVPVLHALLTGSPPISLRYLIMGNIWEAREDMEKKFIPHVRLITALMKSQGVSVSAYRRTEKKLGPLKLSGLSKMNLRLIKTSHHCILRNTATNEEWRVRKENGISSDDVDMGGGGRSEEERPRWEPHMPPPFVYEQVQQPQMPHDPYYSHAGHSYPFGGLPYNVEEYVAQQRPTEYPEWTSYQQRMWDRDTSSGEQARRERQSIYDRQERWNQVHVQNNQMEINANYRDRENERMYNQWRAGEPVIDYSPPLDYAHLPPFDMATNYHPAPSSHHSMWIDPQEQFRYENQMRNPPEQSSSSGAGASDPYHFGDWHDDMAKIFGNPRNPYG